MVSEHWADRCGRPVGEDALFYLPCLFSAAKDADRTAERLDQDEMATGFSVSHVSEKTSPWMSQALNEVTIYKASDLGSLKYTSMPALTSWSCGNLFVSSTEEDAIAHLKLRAKPEANGIVNLSCQSHSLEMRGVCPAENDRPSSSHPEADCSMDVCLSSIDCSGTPIHVGTDVKEAPGVAGAQGH